ncbi:YqaA family protein [Desulfovibrio litoralis]|uniref:Membrane protein YqaA, SNARE-associated domain n=1 Tax=Desulfovibrio litoralis DSM 11393 TaxID=1121455 RepID=A0A1M7RYD3_9BACT|nr:YqaA family protein [Desulfovibrio litoralis]SHN51166.1 membrane protein YqaA, SNARE-associated domain [Desulfovibrio litoralis DSM 11393]
MKLFDPLMAWVWRVSAKEGAVKALAILSFLESIFFPIPPDLLLIPLALSQREKAFKLAFITLISSLFGGIFGYFIGYFFMDTIGIKIMNFYNFEAQYLTIQEWYTKYDAWAVAIAGLTPVPYKLCTLTAGAFKINFFVFIVASTLSRGLRFFAIAGLIYVFGEKVRFFLEKRLDLVMIILLILGVLGFVALKFT